MDGTAKTWPTELSTLFRGDPSLRKIQILPGATDIEHQLRSIVQRAPLEDIHEILQRISEDNKFNQPPLRDIQLGRIARKDGGVDPGLHFSRWLCPTLQDPVFDVILWTATTPALASETFSVLRNGWTRVAFPSSCGPFTFVCAIDLNTSSRHLFKRIWLSQANHCLKQILRSQVEPVADTSFYLCEGVGIEIDVEESSTPRNETPIPYLFLNYPTGDLVDGKFFARIPSLEKLFYWSFDPSGGWRLTDSVVEQLGLPRLTCRTVTYGPSWTSSQYRCLREVHEAKGFDPDGLDAANSLGYPLLILQGDSHFDKHGVNSLSIRL
ncbi:hypothetical protein DFH06DRAFT_560777 [Mycena polygramma]|nr:hypothetical protein DFH06DRAFT_560777 [Mycena polygramma]